MNPILRLFVLLLPAATLLPVKITVWPSFPEPVFVRPEDILVALALTWALFQCRPFRVPLPLVFFLCAELLAAIIGIVRESGAGPLPAALHLAQYVKLAAVFLLVRAAAPNQHEIARAVLLPILVFAAWGIAESVFPVSDPEVTFRRTFEHWPFDSASNAFAGLFVLGVFVSVSVFQSGSRVISCVTLIACLAALPGTRSLEAVIGLLAGLFVFFLRASGLSPRKQVFAVLCAVIAGMALLPMLARDFSSFDARIENWARMIRLAAEHPVFGLGPGRFHRAPYDSQYVMVLVESGLAGFCAFAWMLFKLVRGLWRRGDAAFSAMLAAACVQALAAVCLVSNVPAGVFWWVTGAALAQGNRHRASNGRGELPE